MANAAALPLASPRRAGGRPLACTPIVRSRILEAARTGAHRGTIAAAAGISPRTLHRFLRRGEEALERREEGHALSPEDAEFCQFCLEFRKAEVAVESQLVEVVLTAARSDWRAALAFLERRYPKHWGRRRIVQYVQAPKPERGDPAPATFSVDPLTRELIATELRRRGLSVSGL